MGATYHASRVIVSTLKPPRHPNDFFSPMLMLLSFDSNKDISAIIPVARTKTLMSGQKQEHVLERGRRHLRGYLTVSLSLI